MTIFLLFLFEIMEPVTGVKIVARIIGIKGINRVTGMIEIVIAVGKTGTIKREMPVAVHEINLRQIEVQIRSTVMIIIIWMIIVITAGKDYKKPYNTRRFHKYPHLLCLLSVSNMHGICHITLFTKNKYIDFFFGTDTVCQFSSLFHINKPAD